MSESSKKRPKAAKDEGDEAAPDVAEPAPAAAGEPAPTAAALAKAAEATQELGKRTAEFVAEQYDRASRGTREAYDSALSTGARWEDGLERYVRRNPVTSMLVTAGVSLLIGFALGRTTAKPPPRQHWWRS